MPGTAVIQTENSLYEIDWDARRVRRIKSTHAPTLRQGQDGEWKDFVDVRSLQDRLLIVWAVVDGVEKCTLTSPVIYGAPLEDLQLTAKEPA